MFTKRLIWSFYGQVTYGLCYQSTRFPLPKKKRGCSVFAYVWPLGLVVLSNVLYQIAAKSVPDKVNPFASLTVTYAVGSVFSLLLFFVLGKGESLFSSYRHLNFAPFLLGVVIVGLEVGYIFAYRAGWQVSTAQIVQSAVLAVILIFVGKALYGEPLSWNKLAGILVCLGGLWLIGMKN
ncbi:MAG: DMT family transporter [Clostridia bacterium]|nr:DMT family transporter [Clostridia bacterium]